MQARIYFFMLVFLVSLITVGLAQETAALPEESVSKDDVKETALSFPYFAKITGDNVYIRSGPDTNYYRCGKLNKSDKVTVVATKFSWSQIAPPPGSFSWISKQYVSVDVDNPNIGIVTGDAVRVYAGSNDLKPIHSSTWQLNLNRDDKVTLLDKEQIQGYYKIAPPTGAYFWVSTRYTKPLEPVGRFPLTIGPETDSKVDTREVVPTNLSVEAEKLKEYYALQKQVELERTKPMAKQNYTNIKKALAKIAGNKEAGKAARYCQYVVKQIERFELVLKVEEKVKLQDKQLQQIQETIEKARVKKLAQVADLGRFAAIGQFQTSNIYGTEAELIHYRIIDDSEKTICYALPSDSAPKIDLKKFVGLKVGLVGTIEPHLQTSGALVRFSEITELK